MSTFYVDAIGGLDTNSGSLSGPWQTVERVKTLAASGGLAPGDKVLLRRGREFFGRPTITGVEGAPWITLGDYGSGDLPILSGYKVANSAAGWSEVQPGIWRVDISPSSTVITGDVAGSSGNTDVGFLRIDGKIKGTKLRTVAQLQASTVEWAFTSDAQYLYVRASGNPAGVAGDVRIATRGNIVTPGSGVRILNLDIQGAGGHGVRGRAGIAHGVDVFGCRIHECGGGYLTQDPAQGDDTRFGNGIEVWIGARDWSVMFNEVYDCYDVGFTLQGTATADGINGWSDVAFLFNKVWNNSQAVEFWCAAAGFTGPGFQRVKVMHNDLVNGGYSWGESVPTNSGGRGVTFLSYAMELGVDIEIAHNTVVGSKASYMYHRRTIDGAEVNTVPAGWDAHDNLIVLEAGTAMRKTGAGETRYAIEAAESWSAAEGVERGSLFQVLPTGLLDASNYLERVLAYLATVGAAAEHRLQSAAAGLRELGGRLVMAQSDTAAIGQNGRNAAPNARDSWLFASYGTRSTMAGASFTNRLLAYPMIVGRSGRIQALGVNVTTAGAAGTLVRLAAYRSDGSTLTLIGQGTVSGAATGVAQLALDFTVREGEEIWLASVLPSGTGTLPTIRSVTGQSSPLLPIADASAAFGFNAPVNGLSISGVTGAVPSTIALNSLSGLSSDMPVIGLRTAA